MIPLKPMMELDRWHNDQARRIALASAVADFAAMEIWAGRDEALNNCAEASAAFIKLLRHKGVADCEPVSLIGLPAYVAASQSWIDRVSDPDNDQIYEGHVVVRIEDMCYDWTRRQYVPDALYPTVETWQRLTDDGWHDYWELNEWCVCGRPKPKNEPCSNPRCEEDSSARHCACSIPGGIGRECGDARGLKNPCACNCHRGQRTKARTE